MITYDHLMKAKPENVIRLAKWLKISTCGKPLSQVIWLIIRKNSRGF